MKKEITEKIKIPSDIQCELKGNILECKKGSEVASLKLSIPNISIAIEQGSIIFYVKKANKNERKIINSFIAHIQNLFQGLNQKFTYILESANVHFPMTIKKEGNKIIVNNFLGEKTPRVAEVLPNVSIEIKGSQIIISSSDKPSAGQTAANLENATKVKRRDRRIFQDGIYITQKPGEEK